MKIPKSILFFHYIYKLGIILCLDDICDEIDIFENDSDDIDILFWRNPIELLDRIDSNLREDEYETGNLIETDENRDKIDVQICNKECRMCNRKENSKKIHLKDISSTIYDQEESHFSTHFCNQENANLRTNTTTFKKFTDSNIEHINNLHPSTVKSYKQSDCLDGSVLKDFSYDNKCVTRNNHIERLSEIEEATSNDAHIASIERELIDSSTIFTSDFMKDFIKENPAVLNMEVDLNVLHVDKSIVPDYSYNTTGVLVQTYETFLHNPGNECPLIGIRDSQNIYVNPSSEILVDGLNEITMQAQENIANNESKPKEIYQDIQNTLQKHLFETNEHLEIENGECSNQLMKKDSLIYVKSFNHFTDQNCDKLQYDIESSNPGSSRLLETLDKINLHDNAQSKNQFQKTNTEINIERIQQQENQKENNIKKRALQITQSSENGLPLAKKSRSINRNFTRSTSQAKLLSTEKTSMSIKVNIKSKYHNEKSEKHDILIINTANNCPYVFTENMKIVNIADKKKAETLKNEKSEFDGSNNKLTHKNLQFEKNTTPYEPLVSFEKIENIINEIYEFRFAFMQLNSLKYLFAQKKKEISENRGLLEALEPIFLELKFELQHFNVFYSQLYVNVRNLRKRNFCHYKNLSMEKIFDKAFNSNLYSNFFMEFQERHIKVQKKIYDFLQKLNKREDLKLISDTAFQAFSRIYNDHILPTLVHFKLKNINNVFNRNSSRLSSFHVKFYPKEQDVGRRKPLLTYESPMSFYITSILSIIFDVRSNNFMEHLKKSVFLNLESLEKSKLSRNLINKLGYTLRINTMYLDIRDYLEKYHESIGLDSENCSEKYDLLCNF